MKRQFLLSVSLTLLTSAAFALPANEKATPQVKATPPVFGHTVAADGYDRTPQGQTLAERDHDHLRAKGSVNGDDSDRAQHRHALAADGYDRTQQGKTVAEGGNDRLKEKGLITQDSSDRTPQGRYLAADGYDRTPQGRTVAEGGGDRVIKRNRGLS